MLIDAQFLRQGSSIASLIQMLPHRGESVHEVRGPRGLDQVLQHLRDSFFSGISEVRRGAAPAGVVVHSTGKLTHAFFGSQQAAAALEAIRADEAVSQLVARRTAHPVMVAADALFGGPLTGQWATPGAFEAERATQDLTGALVWWGGQRQVSLYRNGSLCPGFTAPDFSAPGPLLQFSAPMTPTSEDLLERIHSGDRPVPAAPPEVPAVSALDAEVVWRATEGLYEKRLGRAAKPALMKLQRDLAGLPPQDLLTQVKSRLQATFGAAAVAALEERLGER